MQKPVKTRLAPSPTGSLHVGTAHTALFNFLFARHFGGSFVIRVEDTDIERSKKEYEENILEGLAWLGITSDEPVTRQSERAEYYEALLKKLLSDGTIFYCTHSADELEAERQKLMAEGKSPHHKCSYRNAGLDSGVLRIKNDTAEPIVFSDVVRGDISFDPVTFGDFVIAKNISSPLYNFAVAVDDHDMGITNVIRGEDHIANTPKQIMIQRLLGFAAPLYAHIPLLLGTDRSKLSKRHGATSVSEYRDQGYLSDALFNFLALLGWNPGTDQEIFSREELVAAFSLDRVQRSGAIFDTTKLDWMNSEYIKKVSSHDLIPLVTPFLSTLEDTYEKKTDENYMASVIAVEQSRMKKLSDISDKIDYFFHTPAYDIGLLTWKSQSTEETSRALEDARNLIDSWNVTEMTKEDIERILLEKAGAYTDRGSFLWPLRVALSGKKNSPGPFEIISVLGKVNSLRHIDHALTGLKSL